MLSATKENSILTKRELEILQWLHMGKTNWEISSILEISPLTVKNHVQNILRKFDVQNRSQAVVRAAKLGLIDDKA
jgi:DNA-binding CsgD family transcriptional regulator